MLYKTETLEAWKWAKELNQRHYQETLTARERGKLLAVVSGVGPWELFGGMDFEYLFGEPYAARASWQPGLNVEVLEASDAEGYPADVCHYTRIYLGSVLLGKTPFGAFPKPDVVVPDCECTSHGKWMQRVAEYLDVPYFALDHPYWSDNLAEHHIDYTISQYKELIRWLEKVTGREFSVERFLETQRNTMRVKQLWSEITELNKAIPAPLDLKTMFSLFVFAIYGHNKPEAVRFYEALKDEVQHRVDNQIAAQPNERLRLGYWMAPAWHHLRDMRYTDQYGAVFVACLYAFHWGTHWLERPDGTIGPPYWLGTEPKNLDDALRRVAERVLGHPWRVEPMLKGNIKMAKEYKLDAMVLHAFRGCEMPLRGTSFLKAGIQKECHIPIMVYEGNVSDPREYTESKVKDLLESFAESLGARG